MKLKSYSEIVSYKKFKGLTSYFAIGKGKGWKWSKDGPSLIINLGWISFSVMSIDIQNLLAGLLRELQEKDIKEKSVDELTNTLIVQLEEISHREKEIKQQLADYEKLKVGSQKLAKNIEILTEKYEIHAAELTDKIDDQRNEISDLEDDNETLITEIEELKNIKQALDIKLKESQEAYNKQFEEIQQLKDLLVTFSSSSSSDVFSSSSSSS